MAPSRFHAAVALGAALAAPAATGFYLPGVAPTNFLEGQRVELKVMSMAMCRSAHVGDDGLCMHCEAPAHCSGSRWPNTSPLVSLNLSVCAGTLSSLMS